MERLRRSNGGSVALVLTLPAVLLVASEQPGAEQYAAYCQVIVESETARESSNGGGLFSDLAQARIANICASSGALIVESLRHRTGTREEMTLAAASGNYDWPVSRRN